MAGRGRSWESWSEDIRVSILSDSTSAALVVCFETVTDKYIFVYGSWRKFYFVLLKDFHFIKEYYYLKIKIVYVNIYVEKKKALRAIFIAMRAWPSLEMFVVDISTVAIYKLICRLMLQFTGQSNFNSVHSSTVYT